MIRKTMIFIDVIKWPVLTLLLFPWVLFGMIGYTVTVMRFILGVP